MSSAKVNRYGNNSDPWRQEWRTPPELFGRLHSIFGFSVDAAADSRCALLTRYWSPWDCGLRADWSGEVVYCNPPFDRCREWVAKAGEAITAVYLVPSNVMCTRYVARHPPRLVVFPGYRVRFVAPPGVDQRSRPSLGTAVLVYGEVSGSQARALRSVGSLYRAC